MNQNIIDRLNVVISAMDTAAASGNGAAHLTYVELIAIRNLMQGDDPIAIGRDSIPKNVRMYIERGEKINAIKEARHLYGFGLKEGKDMVEDLIAKYYPNWVPVGQRMY